MFLDGHTKEIYSGDWLPNGLVLSSGFISYLGMKWLPVALIILSKYGISE